MGFFLTLQTNASLISGRVVDLLEQYPPRQVKNHAVRLKRRGVQSGLRGGERLHPGQRRHPHPDEHGHPGHAGQHDYSTECRGCAENGVLRLPAPAALGLHRAASNRLCAGRIPTPRPCGCRKISKPPPAPASSAASGSRSSSTPNTQTGHLLQGLPARLLGAVGRHDAVFAASSMSRTSRCATCPSPKPGASCSTTKNSSTGRRSARRARQNIVCKKCCASLTRNANSLKVNGLLCSNVRILSQQFTKKG